MNEYPPAPWGEHPLPERGNVVRFDVGPLVIWMKRVENEIWLTHQRAEGGDESRVTEHPAEADWHRWAFDDRPRRIRLRPAFPDRMIVVKTEHPFTLLSHAEARIYMRVGAWVRVEVVEVEHGTHTTLTEIPTESLSDTWWGTHVEGVLAYWLTTKARRSLSDDLFEPHLIMAVLQLSNQSGAALPVDKLVLRVEHLSIYEQDDRLWAEETRIEYLGEELGSEIHMDDQAPREAEGAREVTPARAPTTTTLRARTFARLRALTPFGIGES